MKTLILLALLTAGLPSIVVAGDDPVPETTFVHRFVASSDSVWNALLEYTIEQGCPLVVNDKANLKLRTAHLRAMRRDVAFGGWLGTSTEVTAIVSVRMFAEGDSATTVHLTASLTALRDMGEQLFATSSEDSNWKPYKTKGSLEHRIFTAIGKRLDIEVPPLPIQDKFLKPRIEKSNKP